MLSVYKFSNKATFLIIKYCESHRLLTLFSLALFLQVEITDKVQLSELKFYSIFHDNLSFKWAVNCCNWIIESMTWTWELDHNIQRLYMQRRFTCIIINNRNCNTHYWRNTPPKVIASLHLLLQEKWKQKQSVSWHAHWLNQPDIYPF